MTTDTGPTTTDTKPDSDAASSARSPLFSRGAMIRTLIMLVLVSFLVGVVLDVLGMAPLDFWRGLARQIRNLAEAVFSIGWGTVSSVFSYVLFGAMIVVPVWLVVTLINLRNRKR